MTLEKKRKLEGVVAAQLAKDDSGEEFKLFKIVRILNDNPQQKTIYIQGRFEGQDDDAVVILEKLPFNQESLSKVFEEVNEIRLTLDNDIYKTYEMFPPPELNGRCTGKSGTFFIHFYSDTNLTIK